MARRPARRPEREGDAQDRAHTSKVAPRPTRRAARCSASSLRGALAQLEGVGIEYTDYPFPRTRGQRVVTEVDSAAALKILALERTARDGEPSWNQPNGRDSRTCCEG